ncbi:lysozyme M1-like [Macrosteles quadrilineatus]|uniref:lysozyme M1-like n=1 Tax=Macrosteles quadrilineatus TaxID=74068 RepID=UPI0023E2E7A0|nr:lysozyme M1-like [Macrosteles quadrilineatus]
MLKMVTCMYILLFTLVAWVAAEDKVVDVSHWNGRINWTEVRAAGVKLAIAKATEGGTYTDDTFATNWRGIKQSGIQPGAYHYLRGGTSTAQAQVQNIKNALKSVNFGANDMLVIDVEEQFNQNVSKDKMADVLKAVLDGLKGSFSNLWIYTGPSYWENKVAWRKYDFSQYKLWIAHYTTKSQPTIPSTWKTKGYSLWQYTDKGRVNGISGNVDMSRY